MKAIILSAGQGKRLLPLTLKTPKAALQVGKYSLLEWQLREISKSTIDEVIVVTGFGARSIEKIASGRSSLKIRTSFNPFYENCDNLGTCWIARAEMNEPFIIINGDTLFEAAILDKVLKYKCAFPITLTCDKKDFYDSDDMKIVEKNGRIFRVGKKLPLNEVTGESIGLVKFDSTGAALFAKKIDEMIRHDDGLGKWYLSAIDAIAERGKVGSCPINGMSWCEIDNATDLAFAKKIVDNWAT